MLRGNYGNLSSRHGASSQDLPTRRIAANMLNKQPRTPDKGRSSRLGVRRRV
jgi:hypothetical protein